MSENFADLQAAVDNIHDALTKCSSRILTALSNQRNFESDAKRWIEYANQLRRLVPDYAVPAWLASAIQHFGIEYDPQHNHHSALAVFVANKSSEINLPILIGEAASLNVEELFREQAEKVNLTDVFEHLVSRLSELIALDVIDNRLVHESLTRLNALLRRNKRGSFAAVLFTMNFGRFFLDSFGGMLRANKYAKPVVESFEKEFAKASEVVQQAEQATKNEMVARLTSPARMQLFIEDNPALRETIAGYLPAPTDQQRSE